MYLIPLNYTLKVINVYCVFLNRILIHSEAICFGFSGKQILRQGLRFRPFIWEVKPGSSSVEMGKVSQGKQTANARERLWAAQQWAAAIWCWATAWPWSQHLPGGREGCRIYHWLPFYSGGDLPLGALTPLSLSELFLRVIKWCPAMTEKAITQNRGEGWVLEAGVSCKLRWVPGMRVKASTTSQNGTVTLAAWG